MNRTKFRLVSRYFERISVDSHVVRLSILLWWKEPGTQLADLGSATSLCLKMTNWQTMLSSCWPYQKGMSTSLSWPERNLLRSGVFQANGTDLPKEPCLTLVIQKYVWLNKPLPGTKTKSKKSISLTKNPNWSSDASLDSTNQSNTR